MLAVSSASRKNGIATSLVQKTIEEMERRGADEVVLETEESNVAAMRLYERLGFLRSKKLNRYYLNGSSAYRLVLFLRGVGEMGGGLEGDEGGII
jgi:peptide alpha-N-acetyltransferase